MHADDHLRPWHEAAADLIPGLELFDAHTHTGENDPDGIRCTADELIEGLELAGARERGRAGKPSEELKLSGFILSLFPVNQIALDLN